ncbi:MAG: hypothetical protein QOF24_1601 [Verrucomicrobiota bacterium]|jgi:hypothetical protein
MPHDVFLSHSTDDKLVALALCNKLESAGVRCWMAPRDVLPGAEWGKAIVDAIRECRIMVLIFSSKANDSRHIHREVQTAFEQDLTVIPFRVENTQPTGTMEYYLGSVHWLDALTAPVESHMMGVVDRVKALLPAAKSEPAVEATPPVPQPVPPIVSHPESPPSEPEKFAPPESKKVPRNIVPPLPMAPLSVTSGPAAQIAPPLARVASSGRKKMIQRVLMGVVGVIAILYGARQVANGLHLFSSKSSSTSTSREPAPVKNEISNEMTQLRDSVLPAASPVTASKDPATSRYIKDESQGAFLADCAVWVPKGWEKTDPGGGGTMYSAPKSSGLSANLIVTSQPFAGSLREYANATITAVKASSPSAREVSDEEVTNFMRKRGYKVLFQNKNQGRDITQALYFFGEDDGPKVVMTTTAVAAQAAQLAPLFDQCAKTLIITRTK